MLKEVEGNYALYYFDYNCSTSFGHKLMYCPIKIPPIHLLVTNSKQLTMKLH